MVCFHSSVSVNSSSQSKSVTHTDTSCSKVKQIRDIPCCDQSRSALIDVIILIAVICSCVVLLYPYAYALAHKTIELVREVFDVLYEEITRAPLVFGCLGISLFLTSTALVAIIVHSDTKCGKPGCRGLRKAAEFDIQLEMDDAAKKPSNGLRKGLFELPRDHHRELEAELKKMAPVNGRAVLVFRARCGCPVGRMEVPGPRKSRKVKK